MLMVAKEEVIDEKEKIINENNNVDDVDKKTNMKKRIRIFNISLWRIFAYFVIYSVVGFVIETLYGAVTKGILESRQSFLYGPFCSIYGLGATVMIVCLQKFKKSHNMQFIGGFLLGSVVEYSVSFLGEMILHVKWWDYSSLPFNINGRICVAFSVFWGILAIYLMGSFNPKVDKLIDKIKSKVKNEKILKTIIVISVIILYIDCVITGIAIKFFQIRKIEEYNLNVKDRETISRTYNDIYGNEKLSKFIYKFWNDEKMIKTFPNLKIEDVDGNIIYFDSLVPNVKPYYFVVYDKSKLKINK